MRTSMGLCHYVIDLQINDKMPPRGTWGNCLSICQLGDI